MKRLLVISLIFVLVAACGHKDKTFVPSRLLAEQEMIAIMADVQIIEAEINQLKAQERTQADTLKPKARNFVEVSSAYYNQLFEHYGITDSIFAQNLRYYTERPAELEKIMDSVMQRLTREQSASQWDDNQ